MTRIASISGFSPCPLRGVGGNAPSFFKGFNSPPLAARLSRLWRDRFFALAHQKQGEVFPVLSHFLSARDSLHPCRLKGWVLAMLGAKPLRVALLPRSAPLPLHGLRLSVPCESGSENREQAYRLILSTGLFGRVLVSSVQCECPPTGH